MDVWFAVLRLFHVFSTVLWIGVAVTNIAFVVPTAGKLGPDGGKFMGAFLRGPVMTVTNVAIGFAALSGLLLYWRDSSGLSVAWTTSGKGISFTAGALFGLAAAVLFGAVTLPLFRRLIRVGGEVAAAGGPPKPEMAALLAVLQRRSLVLGRFNAGLLGAALFAMVLGGSY